MISAMILKKYNTYVLAFNFYDYNEPKERMNLHKQEGRSLLISYFSVITYVNHLNDQCTLCLGYTIIQL